MKIKGFIDIYVGEDNKTTIVCFNIEEALRDIFKKYSREIKAYKKIEGKDIFTKEVFMGIAKYHEGDKKDDKTAVRIAAGKARRSAARYISKCFKDMYVCFSKTNQKLSKDIVKASDEVIKVNSNLINLIYPDITEEQNNEFYNGKILIITKTGYELKFVIKNGKFLDFTNRHYLPADYSFRTKEEIIKYFTCKNTFHELGGEPAEIYFSEFSEE